MKQQQIINDYDLLALFTAACLGNGKSPEDAVTTAYETLDLFRNPPYADDGPLQHKAGFHDA